MKILIYSIQGIETGFLEKNEDLWSGVDVVTTEKRLSTSTADMAAGFDAVCAFVNDDLQRAVLRQLSEGGTHLILMRCAGYDVRKALSLKRVDLPAAKEFGFAVLRVPAYSPFAVAEHAVTLLVCLNRRIVKAANRTREHDFYLRGLVGRDINGKTVACIGTGKIGRIFCKIMMGFGCKVLAYDLYENEELKQSGVEYGPLHDVLSRSDFVSLHCPLLESTFHLINTEAIGHMKPGALLVNCGRGALVSTDALVEGLRKEEIGGYAMDVYEREAGMFFSDLSDKIIPDADFLQLQGFPNVLITPHIAFCTEEAMLGIWSTTRANFNAYVDAKKTSEMQALPNNVVPLDDGSVDKK